MTTFSQLWNAIRITWRSRPFAIILPVLALGWYFWTHGHKFVLATEKNGGSLPTWQEFIAGAALLTTKWERVTEFFLGAPSPVPNPPAPPAGPVVVLLLGFLALGASGCATVQPIVKDVETCAGPACADIATKLLPAAEIVLECELATAGAALPACAENGLSALAAAAGPDGWRIVACIVDAIEKDATKPPELRARARAARPVVAMHKALGR